MTSPKCFLLSYTQRNVGILEKIVQSMTGTQHSAETAEQYKAQVDVVAQLATRVEQQLSTAKQRTADTAKTALIKLERDFHRVQERVAALQESVTQMRAAQQRKAAASASLREHSDRGGGGGSGQEAMGHEEFQQLVQMQLQEDVSHDNHKRKIVGDPIIQLNLDFVHTETSGTNYA